MRHLLLAIFVTLLVTGISQAAENIYPLEVRMEVYPKEIRFGDICFVEFSVANHGKETLLLPYGATFLITIYGELISKEKQILFLGGYDSLEGVLPHVTRGSTYRGRPVKPGETMKFHLRMLWFPLPEFAHRADTAELQRTIDQSENDFTIRLHVRYRFAYRATSRPRSREPRFIPENFSKEALTSRELEAKGYLLAKAEELLFTHEQLECAIRILPRQEKELKLLQEWYLELPTMKRSADRWTMEHVFAHPFHVRASPYKMDAPTPFELGQKRSLFHKEYREFYAKVLTRTPEIQDRIQRTNELAQQILNLAKEPESTISRNMQEFILLRSFLVEMRYAENEDSEKAVFEKLCDFVEKSHDKSLWIKFVPEVALPSIQTYEIYPREKIDHYVKQFQERFSLKTK